MNQRQTTPTSVKKVSPKRILALLVALIVCAVLFSSVLELFKKQQKIRVSIKEFEKEKQELQEKYTRVSELNTRVQTKEGQEYILRDKYRMVRPGEELIVVTEDSLVAVEKKQSGFRRFWDRLFSVFKVK